MSDLLLTIIIILLALISVASFILAALLIVYIFRRPPPDSSKFGHKKFIILTGLLVWIGTFFVGLGPLLYLGLNVHFLRILTFSGFLFGVFFIVNLFYAQLLRAKAIGN